MVGGRSKTVDEDITKGNDLVKKKDWDKGLYLSEKNFIKESYDDVIERKFEFLKGPKDYIDATSAMLEHLKKNKNGWSDVKKNDKIFDTLTKYIKKMT